MAYPQQYRDETAGGGDAPQLMFGRYLELLRRRWWQVVPISILGMLIGGISASLVPRFYVTSTQIQYKGSPFTQTVGTLNDPMAGELRAAESTIPSPQTVQATLRELGWPEYTQLDEEGRAAYVRETIDRIDVYDVVVSETRARQFLMIGIQYKDLDAERAVTFLDTLRDQWIAERRAEMLAQGEAELRRVQWRLVSARTQRDELSSQLAAYERQYELDPFDRGADQPLLVANKRATDNLNELRGEIAELESMLAGKQARIDQLEQRLPVIPKTVRLSDLPKAVEEVDPIAQQQRRIVATQLVQVTREIEAMKPANPRYEGRIRQREQLLVKARALGLELGPAAAPGGVAEVPERVPNPEYADAETELEELRAEVVVGRERLAEMNADLAAANERRDRLPEIFEPYNQMRADYAQQQQLVETHTEELIAKQELFEDIQSNNVLQVVAYPFEPEAPTDPSIVVLALLGTLLGLGLAVGIVLLWDLLQSTFKSVDDVERGLALPVLGTMAHLETIEERLAAASSRRRVSIAAGAFLVFTLFVVTIYYVAPTRLPPIVIEVFDLLLGGR